MASLRQIRRRMKSIESINEITKAMEMIAAFRFKKAENRFSKSRPFLLEMEKMAAHLSASATDLADAFFEARDVKKKALVVMTGDKGLCGAYNANILRVAAQWKKDNAGFETAFIPVGKVGFEYFRKRHLPVAGGWAEKAKADAALARTITDELKKLFLTRAFDSVELLYTTYRVGGTGANRVQPFLGLNYLMEARGKEAPAEYLYEPDFKTVFLSLVSRYLEGWLYLSLLESLTSEYSARMVAMKQASENGEEVLASLKLLRNKTRQATITRELSEIVSGASVLV